MEEEQQTNRTQTSSKTSFICMEPVHNIDRRNLQKKQTYSLQAQLHTIQFSPQTQEAIQTGAEHLKMNPRETCRHVFIASAQAEIPSLGGKQNDSEVMEVDTHVQL